MRNSPDRGRGRTSSWRAWGNDERAFLPERARLASRAKRVGSGQAAGGAQRVRRVHPQYRIAGRGRQRAGVRMVCLRIFGASATVIIPMVSDLLYGKTILITGGTGSFGSTVLATLLSLAPAKIIIFSRDEKKQFDLRNAIADPRLEFRLGDVRDRASVDKAMRRVDLVFHAAALKQVPSGEFFPLELVKTNILGSANVIDSAIEAGVERVVFLSTDKAVYPINVMGLTKALMEKLMISEARVVRTKTILCGVRYGNVMYSRGSVIPLFVEQLKARKSLTLTHPDMTRFLLPLSQAAELVLYALSNGQPGNLFVRRAPAATMSTLASALQRVFGVQNEVAVIGVRGGEKMHETLISAEELSRAEELGDYYRILPEARGLDYERYFTRGSKNFFADGGYTSANTQRLSVEETVKLLESLPEIQAELKTFRRL